MPFCAYHKFINLVRFWIGNFEDHPKWVKVWFTWKVDFRTIYLLWDRLEHFINTLFFFLQIIHLLGKQLCNGRTGQAIISSLWSEARIFYPRPWSFNGVSDWRLQLNDTIPDLIQVPNYWTNCEEWLLLEEVSKIRKFPNPHWEW